MQRTFVAITLALALTSVLGAYSPSKYVKGPIVVAQDNETNFTTNASTSTLGLASITVGDVYLTAKNSTVNPANVSSIGWTVYAKKLEAKALTAASPLTYNFNSTTTVIYVNNYAIGFDSDTEANATNLRIYQVPLTGGAAFPRLTLTNYTNDNVNVPKHLTHQIVGKTVYVFFNSVNKTVNVTSFTIGGALSTTNFILTNDYSEKLSVTWGESLGTSKVFAMWVENGTLKDSAIDVSKGTVNASVVGGYDNTNYTCLPYATDKTWYGEVCMTQNMTQNVSERTVTYWLRTNTSSLFSLATYNLSTSTYNGHYAYGPYLILDVVDNTNASATLHSYEIWNLDTRALFTNRTLYLQIDTTTSVVTPFRVVSGGLYTLLYDKPVTSATSGVKGPITNVQVGLLLGSSYLASVFGFLLTIIAGLLLF